VEQITYLPFLRRLDELQTTLLASVPRWPCIPLLGIAFLGPPPAVERHTVAV